MLVLLELARGDACLSLIIVHCFQKTLQRKGFDAAPVSVPRVSLGVVSLTRLNTGMLALYPPVDVPIKLTCRFSGCGCLLGIPAHVRVPIKPALPL